MIEEIATVLKIAKSAVELGKEAKSLLPNSEEKEQIELRLEDVEKELRIAEASTAKELGYDLCQCSFPPQIMLFNNEKGATVCPNCGNSCNKRTTVAFSL